VQEEKAITPKNIKIKKFENFMRTKFLLPDTNSKPDCDRFVFSLIKKQNLFACANLPCSDSISLFKKAKPQKLSMKFPRFSDIYLLIIYCCRKISLRM
jgi:hypothetical protein